MTLGLGLGLGQNRRIATIDDESSVPIPAPQSAETRRNATDAACVTILVALPPKYKKKISTIYENDWDLSLSCSRTGNGSSQPGRKQKEKKKGGAYHIIPSFSVQPELLVN